MIEIVDHTDLKAVRNKNNALALYEGMINTKRPAETIPTLLDPSYKQHNSITPDLAAGLSTFWSKLTSERPLAKAKVHRIIATGDWVWAHVNFTNLFNDDPSDLGLAVVDIFKMDEHGKAVEHWDVIMQVGTHDNAAPWLAPNMPAANTNGMF